MRVHRRIRAQCANHVDLSRRVVHVVVAADDVGNAHVEIIDDDAEVVSRRAVGARDDEVVQLAVVDFDRPLDLVLPRNASVQRVLEPIDRRNARRRRLPRTEILGTPAAVIAWLLSTRHLLGSHSLELGRRRVAAIRLSARQHLIEHGTIAIDPLHLVERSFVVIEP